MFTSKNKQNYHKQEQQKQNPRKIKMQRTKQELIQELLRPFIKEKQNLINELNRNKMHSETQIQSIERQKTKQNQKRVNNFSQQFSNQEQKFDETRQNSKLTKKWINKQNQKLKPVFYPSSELNHAYNQQQQNLTCFLQNFVRQSQKVTKPLRQQASLNTKSSVEQIDWKNWDNSKQSNANNEQQRTKSKFHRKQQKPINKNVQDSFKKREVDKQIKESDQIRQNNKYETQVINKNKPLNLSSETLKDINNHILKGFQSDDDKSSGEHHFTHNQSRSGNQSIQNVTRNDLELINYLTSIKKATGDIHQLSEDQIKLKQLNFGEDLSSEKNTERNESNAEQSEYFDKLMRNKSKQKQMQIIKQSKNNNQKYPISNEILKSMNEQKEHANKTIQNNSNKNHNENKNENLPINKKEDIEQKLFIKPSKLHQLLKNKKLKNNKNEIIKNKQDRQEIIQLQPQAQNFFKQQKISEQKVKKWQKENKQSLNKTKQKTQTVKQVKNQVKNQVQKSSQQQLIKNKKNLQVQSLVKEVQQNMNEVLDNLNKIQQQNVFQQQQNCKNREDVKNKQIDFQLSFSDLSSQTVHPYAVSFSKFSDIEERKQQVNESYQFNGINANQFNQNKKLGQNFPTIQIKKPQPASREIDIDLSKQIKKIQQEETLQKVKENINNQPKKAKVRVIELSLDQKQDTIELRQSDQLNYVSSSEEQKQNNIKKEENIQNQFKIKKNTINDSDEEIQLKKYFSSSEEHSLQEVKEVQDEDDQKKSTSNLKGSGKNSQKSKHLSQKEKLQKQFLSDFTDSDISIVKSNKSLKNHAKDVSDQDFEIQKSIINDLKSNVQNLKQKMLSQAGQSKNNSKTQNQNLFKQFEKKSQKHIQIDLTKQLKEISQKSDKIPKIKKTSSKSTNKIKSSSDQNYEHLFDLNSSSQKNKDCANISQISIVSEPKKENKQILDQFQNLNQISKKKKSQIYKDFNDHIIKLKDKISSDYFNQGSNEINKNNQSQSKNNSSKIPSSNQTSNEVSRKGSSGASNAFSAVQQIPESLYLTNLKFSQKPTLKNKQSKNQSGESQIKNKSKLQKQIDSHSMWGLIQRAKQ